MVIIHFAIGFGKMFYDITPSVGVRERHTRGHDSERAGLWIRERECVCNREKRRQLCAREWVGVYTVT